MTETVDRMLNRLGSRGTTKREMATGTTPRKPNAKEEAKDCCGGYRQPSVTAATSTSSASPDHATLGHGNVANPVNDTNGVTATRPPTTTTTTTATTASMTVIATTTAISTATTTMSVSSPTGSAGLWHSSTAACSVHDPFRGDPDLGKTTAKASIATREKSSRDDGRSETPSPSSRHRQRQPAMQRSDNDSPVPSSSRTLKPETEDAAIDDCGGGGGGGGGTEETKDDASSASSASSSGGTGIAGVFAGHGELKSVLGTVVKFATGISPDTGDAVLTLVLALLSGGMTAEEFHSALQETTNYSLKGFVLPHLEQQLPTLRRDLSNAARASNQSCAQFLRSNEAAVLEAVGLVGTTEPVEIFGELTGNGTTSGSGGDRCSVRYGAPSTNTSQGVDVVRHTGNATGGPQRYSNVATPAPKRRASDTPYYENGAALLDDVPVYGKRLTNPWNRHPAPQQQQQQQQQRQQQQQQPPSTDRSSNYRWYHPFRSTSGSIQGHGHRPAHGHGPSSIPTGSLQMSRMNAFAGSHHPIQQPSPQQQQQQQMSHGQAPNGSLDDEWKNIHMMLNCILGMVEKTKKALAILQSRGCSAVPTTTAAAATPLRATSTVSGQNGAANNGHPSSTNGSRVESSTGDREGSLKRLSGEIVAQTIRAIEDKVAEVKRKDEEAVKRAVMAEVQRAVRAAVAESRASERLRVHHRLLDVPLSRRSHGALRQPAYLRVRCDHGPVDANAGTAAAPAAASSSIPSPIEDEKDPHPQQTVSGSNCWNCGRPALETCGGCGIARYCGSFCQHRDWEAGGHHATCNNNPPPREPRRSPSPRSPPRIPSGALSTSPTEAKLGSVAATAAPTPASHPSKGK